MADGRSGFDPVGRAWNVAKIYNGSNVLKHFNGIVQSDSMRTLGDFVRDPDNNVETRGIDFDAKADERLQKYNIVKITPTRNLGELKNPLEMYLITDDKGHDIGTYTITETGPIFKLSPKIKEYNDKIIAKFEGQGKEILEERYEPSSFEKTVKKLANGEEIALSSQEQARDDISEEFTNKGMPVDNGEKKQAPEEKEALAKIPADMRGEAIEFARDKGLQVKEILVVDNPTYLARMIDNTRYQISEAGGPVILIKTRSGKLDSGEDVYAVQGGQPKQEEVNDPTLSEFMNKHREEEHITGLEPKDINKDVQEAQKIIDESERRIRDEENRIAQARDNIDKINTGAVQLEEGQSVEEMIAALESTIAGSEDNIQSIISDRDNKIRDLYARGSKEITRPSDNSKRGDEFNDGIPEKNRWDTANLYNTGS